MAQAIRKVGLSILVACLKLFARPARAGWRRSAHPPTLRGR